MNIIESRSEFDTVLSVLRSVVSTLDWVSPDTTDDVYQISDGIEVRGHYSLPLLGTSYYRPPNLLLTPFTIRLTFLVIGREVVS